MRKTIAGLLCAVLLAGCASNTETPTVTTAAPSEDVPPLSFSGTMAVSEEGIPFASRFSGETAIVLSDTGIRVDGGGETDDVFTSHDIIYYEDREAYESGNPYGEGTDADRHSADEAATHTVVNITAPGTYRVSGTLSAGQIRVDLGEDAFEDPGAVVELILDNADITCTVAPAVLFLNVYECDNAWSADTAKSSVDTSGAGANLVLEGESTVTGGYVAKIYKDKEGEKKLWKQDGAIYSYMSMNVFGPGALTLNAANEGLDTELHLTVNGGKIAIFSDNDGINTNEDGVSVTTINGGRLHITAGLGAEGDGIDSNGWLVINGGTVISSANPAADAGLDSDMGSYVNGGTVIALGSTMDWAESDSSQVTMNLQFAAQQKGDSAIVVTKEDGAVLFAYDPGEDEILGQERRSYMGAIVSCPGFAVGESCHVYLDGSLTGSETGGVYSDVTSYEGGMQMQYTGNDLRGGFGGFPGGQMPEGMEPPEGFDGKRPEGGMGTPPDWNGEMPTMPEGETFPQGPPPEGFEGQEPPEGFEGQEPPEGFGGQRPQGGFGKGDREQGGIPEGPANTRFLLADKVNAFSGVTEVQ